MKAKKVYWAGDLFDLKDLLGNRILADAFERQSKGRWKVDLPQEIEADSAQPDLIRDNDLELLFAADGVVANFDGHDLDSGTVVEFCYAKFIDLPTVLFRTDFRNNNDTLTCPDPWNLMCSGYPRSEVLLYNAMKGAAKLDFISMAIELGRRIVQALDRCDAMPRVAKTPEEAFFAFKHAVFSAGGTMPERFPDSRIRELIAARFASM